MYVIKAGNLYLHRISKRTYDLVPSKKKAIKYAEENHCYNVIPTLPDELLRPGEKWTIFDANLDIPILKKVEPPAPVIAETPEPVEAPKPEYNPNLDNIAKQLIELSKSNYGTRLFSELSKVEEALCDMYHYIEFTDLNACDGYKIYKELQTILRKRRVCKDSIKLLTALKDNCNFEQISAVKKELTDRHYKPRQLTELFE